MKDRITYPFPNFNRATVEDCEWISNFIPHFIMNVLIMMGLKLNHVSKRSPWEITRRGFWNQHSKLVQLGTMLSTQTHKMQDLSLNRSYQFHYNWRNGIRWIYLLILVTISDTDFLSLLHYCIERPDDVRRCGIKDVLLRTDTIYCTKRPKMDNNGNYLMGR